MTGEGLKLTVFFGERDRANGRFLAEEVAELFERHELRAGAVFRGAAGFGMKHPLQTDRLLSLSEDLPMMATAIDVPARIETAAQEVLELTSHGTVALEHVGLLDGRGERELGEHPEGEKKLTVYLARTERVGRRPAHVAVVDQLRRCGAQGATVLLGVDGSVGGGRRRATFFGANPGVPLLVTSVGDRDHLDAAAAALAQWSTPLAMTVEHVTTCKRDGERLADLPRADPDSWQRLTIYGGAHDRHEERPQHVAILETLRRHGSAGATTLRGIWGFHGDHEPHGDAFWSIQRRTPVVTVMLDRAAKVRAAFAEIDPLTAHAGLVTCQSVPAVRSSAPAGTVGGLESTG